MKHSVVLDKAKCKGCYHCMRNCPTEAIRIRKRKAVIIDKKCIDCGECIKVCPYHAKDSISDSFSCIDSFRYKVAIPSPVVYSQMPLGTDLDSLLNAFRQIGFDYVYEEALAGDIISEALRVIIDDKSLERPIISSYCPAIVRLIQMKYPSLIGNIAKLETPVEVASRYIKKKLSRETGLSYDEIGVFYITPCPARVTSIHFPLGLTHSLVDGAISLKDIYAILVRTMSTKNTGERYQLASPDGVGFARVGGQSYSLGIENYLAVDGISSVIKVLDEIERGKLDHIEFLEALACIGGCVGGALTVENAFIAKTRVRNLTKTIKNINLVSKNNIHEMCINGELFWTEEIKPLVMEPFDSDFMEALRKADLLEKIHKSLPMIDCGTCGAPTCRALAEDFIRDKAKIDDCIYMIN